MAKINMYAPCSQINVQQVKIKQILLHQRQYPYYKHNAFPIHAAMKVSLSDIIFENNILPGSLLVIHGKGYSNVTINGPILFRAIKIAS